MLHSRGEGVKHVRWGNLVLGENSEGVIVKQGQPVLGDKGDGGNTVTVGVVPVCAGGEGGKLQIGRKGKNESVKVGESVVGRKSAKEGVVKLGGELRKKQIEAQ